MPGVGNAHAESNRHLDGDGHRDSHTVRADTVANDAYYTSYMNSWDWGPWGYGYPYGWPYVDSIYNY